MHDRFFKTTLLQQKYNDKNKYKNKYINIINIYNII